MSLEAHKHRITLVLNMDVLVREDDDPSDVVERYGRSAALGLERVIGVRPEVVTHGETGWEKL